jgi:hypothetical protein
MIKTSLRMGRRTSSESRSQTDRGEMRISSGSHEIEKLTDGDRGDFRAWRRWRAIGAVGGIGSDAQDDAVAVLNLEGHWLAKRAVLDRYSEGASVKRVARVDDRNSRDVVLTLDAARGIKKIPRLTHSRGW